jgi:hypothetical protein
MANGDDNEDLINTLIAQLAASSPGASNSILAGQGTLIRQMIQSPNYIIGVSGWTINKDGSAEFNNLTIRGTFAGTDFVVDSSGIFFYNGTPAAGNLILALTNVGGSDSFGNTFIQGVTVGNDAGVQVLLATLSNTQAAIQFPTNTSIEQTAANITANNNGAGALQFLQLAVSGPRLNVAAAMDWMQILFNSANEGNTSSANMEFIYVGSNQNPHIQAVFDETGFNILAGTIAAATPGSLPATPETWHSLGAFSTATWTVNTGRYRITAEGECLIDISLNAQVGGGAAGAFTWANNLLAAYQFAGNYTRAYAIGFNGTITTATNNADLLVDGAGTSNPGRVRVQLPALPATTNATISQRIPLN